MIGDSDNDSDDNNFSELNKNLVPSDSKSALSSFRNANVNQPFKSPFPTEE